MRTLNPRVLVLRHVPHEGLGVLAGVFKKAGFSYGYLDVWKKAPRFPSPSSLRAVVIMGGPMGVCEQDRYPFLKKEISYIRRVLRAKKPLLGICLGAQLIARALGSRVYPGRRKEIGWHPLETSRAARRDPLFRHLPRRSWAFQWHGDTFDLPRGSVLLARSALCRNQAFRYRHNVYGLQFHLEVDAAMIRGWLRQPGSVKEVNRIAPGALADLTRGLRTRLPRMERLSRPFFGAFTNLLSGGCQNRLKNTLA